MNLPPSPVSTHRRAASVLWQLAAICLLILGAKLWLIGTYSSPLPFLDQWKGEGDQLLRPWMRGELRLADFFIPFNEHRILPTRLLVLALFEANARQWDAQVQMIAGAAVHTGCACVLGAFLAARLGSRRKWLIFAALLALFGLPYDWQNTLWGFQSQFYFLILFSLLTFWGLGGHRAGSACWWVGAAAGLLACVSMGSGGFAGIALGGWLALKLLRDPTARRVRGNWATLAVSVALGGLALALYTPPTSTSLSSLHAPTFGAFLHGIGLHLGWPTAGSALFALPASAPIVILLGIYLRQIRRPSAAPTDHSLEEFLFPLALWVLLQAAALAYCRNVPAAGLISRYMDLFALGTLVNFAALLRLLDLAAPRWTHRAALAGTIAWTSLTVLGLTTLTQRNLRRDLPNLNQMQRVQAAAIRQFQLTDQIGAFGGKRVFGLTPDEFAILADLLRDPLIRDTLPAGLGLRRTPAPPGPLSTTAQTLAGGWELPIGAGLLIILLVAISDALTARRAGQALALDVAICRIPS